MYPKVALVIPVHNRRNTTLQGLSSLHRIQRTGLDVHIFVVDDGSTDGTSQAIESEYPDVTVLFGDGSLHYAGGTNRGIEAALDWGSDFIVTMNDDSIFHEEFLVRLVETARDNKRSVVGSLLLLWDNPHMTFQIDPKWSVWQGGWVFPRDLSAFSGRSAPFKVECLVGNCVLFPAAAIRENGMLDEKNFPAGWGDAQFAMRLRKAGWQLLIDPRSKVWCEPNTYPKPLHSLGRLERLKVLVLDRKHPANLSRQFKAMWHSAPSKPNAVAAFLSYVSHLFLKAARIIPFAEKS